MQQQEVSLWSPSMIDRRGGGPTRGHHPGGGGGDGRAAHFQVLGAAAESPVSSPVLRPSGPVGGLQQPVEGVKALFPPIQTVRRPSIFNPGFGEEEEAQIN